MPLSCLTKGVAKYAGKPNCAQSPLQSYRAHMENSQVGSMTLQLNGGILEVSAAFLILGCHN